jgi:hypothetical protein
MTDDRKKAAARLAGVMAAASCFDFLFSEDLDIERPPMASLADAYTQVHYWRQQGEEKNELDYVAVYVTVWMVAQLTAGDDPKQLDETGEYALRKMADLEDPVIDTDALRAQALAFAHRIVEEHRVMIGHYAAALERQGQVRLVDMPQFLEAA